MNKEHSFYVCGAIWLGSFGIRFAQVEGILVSEGGDRGNPNSGLGHF